MSSIYGEISGVVKIDESPAERDLIAISYEPQLIDDGQGGTTEKRIVVAETRSAPDGTYTMQTPGFIDEVVVLALDNYGEVWRPNRSYNVGQRIRPTQGNETGFGYDITAAGNSGETEPLWWVPAGGSDTGQIGAATARAKPLWWSVAHAPILPTAGNYVPWTPAELAGELELWLDASDTGTITYADGAVTELLDKSAKARNFAQPVVNSRPATGMSTLNGLNILDFAGDHLTSVDPMSEWNFLHLGDSYEVFAVVKFGTSANPGTVYGLYGNTGASTNARRGGSLYWDDRSSNGRNEGITSLISNGSSSDPYRKQVINNSPNGRFPANTFTIVGAQHDPDNIIPANRSLIRNAGDTADANNIDDGPVDASDASYSTLDIGGCGQGSIPFTGSLAEFIIIRRPDDVAKRQVVEGYLAHKWGLTANLPSDHPYKTTAPVA